MANKPFQAWRSITICPSSEKEIQKLYGAWLPSGGRQWWQVSEAALEAAIKQSAESRGRATDRDMLVAVVHQDVALAGNGVKQFCVRFRREYRQWTLESVHEIKPQDLHE